MFDIFLGIFCIILFFIAFNLLLDGFENFIFGCGRKFKNERKCKRWTCKNKEKCSFWGGKK